MKKAIYLTDGDIDFVNGNIILTSRDDRVRQLIENALSIRKGEWFYNTNTGLDHTELFKKSPDLDALEIAIIDTLNGLEEVEKVTEINIEYDREERKADISLKVRYNLGNVEVEVTL